MIRHRVLRLPVAHLRRITAELSRDLLRMRSQRAGRLTRKSLHVSGDARCGRSQSAHDPGGQIDRKHSDLDPPDAQPASVTKRSGPPGWGACGGATAHRITRGKAGTAGIRAPCGDGFSPRRPQQNRAHSAERLHAGDGLDRGSLCIIELPPRAAFFERSRACRISSLICCSARPPLPGGAMSLIAELSPPSRGRSRGLGRRAGAGAQLPPRLRRGGQRGLIARSSRPRALAIR
jgi:hypothetical protein